MTDGSIFFESGTNLPETAAQIFEAGQRIVSTFEKINATKVSPSAGEATAGLRKMLTEYEQIGQQLGREIQKIKAQANEQIATPGAAGVPTGDIVAKMNQAGKVAAERMLSAFARDIEQAPAALKSNGVMAQMVAEVGKEFDQFVRQQASEARKAIQAAARAQGVQPSAVLGSGRLNYPRVNDAAQQQLANNPFYVDTQKLSAATNTSASEATKQAALQRQITDQLRKQLDASVKAAQASGRLPANLPSLQIPPPPRVAAPPSAGTRDREFRQQVIAAEAGQVAQRSGTPTPSQDEYDRKRARLFTQLGQGVVTPDEFSDGLLGIGSRPIGRTSAERRAPAAPPAPPAPVGPKARREAYEQAEAFRLAQLENNRTGPDTPSQVAYEKRRAAVVQNLKDQQYAGTGFEESIARIGERPGTPGGTKYPMVRRSGYKQDEIGPRRTPQSYGFGEHIPGGRVIATAAFEENPVAFLTALRAQQAGQFERDNNMDGTPYTEEAAQRYKHYKFTGYKDAGLSKPEELTVQIDQLKSFQKWVDSGHVAELAKIPQSEFQGKDKPNTFQLPEEENLPDGRPTYLVRDGYHRSAAASLRGDGGVQIQNLGTYSRYPDSDQLGHARASMGDVSAGTISAAERQQEEVLRQLAEAQHTSLSGSGASQVSGLNLSGLQKLLADINGPAERAGVSVSEGLAEGMQSSSGKVTSAAGEVAHELIRKMLGDLGIASPSKITTEAGQDVVQGLINGMHQLLGKLRAEAETVANVLNEELGEKPKKKTPRYRDPVTGKFAKRPAEPEVGAAGGGAKPPAEPPVAHAASEPEPPSRIDLTDKPKTRPGQFTQAPIDLNRPAADVTDEALARRAQAQREKEEALRRQEIENLEVHSLLPTSFSEILPPPPPSRIELPPSRIDLDSKPKPVYNKFTQAPIDLNRPAADVTDEAMARYAERMKRRELAQERKEQRMQEGLPVSWSDLDPSTPLHDYLEAPIPNTPRNIDVGKYSKVPYQPDPSVGHTGNPSLSGLFPSLPQDFTALHDIAALEDDLRSVAGAAGHGGGGKPPRPPAPPSLPFEDPSDPEHRPPPGYKTPAFLAPPPPQPPSQPPVPPETKLPPGYVLPDYLKGTLHRDQEPDTYVSRINQHQKGAFDLALAEAPARDREIAARKKREEAIAEAQRLAEQANRAHIADAQVAQGTATRAGGFTFGPDGSVVTSAGKLVTEYKELKTATDALSASVERQIHLAREADAAAGKTPLNQFYKGFLGAGGRKRHGGAQDVDEENPLNGLFETAGVVAKYEILGRGMSVLAGQTVDAIRTFGELDRATRELNEQLGEGAHVSDAFVSNLENVATAGGVGVVEAMDAARRGVAAFSDANATAAQKQQIATQTAEGAIKNSVVTGQTVPDATNDLVAIAGSFGLGQAAGGLDAVTNAVATAKESFGSDSNQVQKGLAELAGVGREAGFSLDQLAQVIGLVQAKTGESGTAIAGTFTRIFSTLQNPTTSADLETKLGIKLSGNASQKLSQIAGAYNGLTDAERQYLETQVGGAKGLRELEAFIKNQPAYLAAAKKATEDSSAGTRQYNAIINSLAGQLKVFGASIKQLGLDIARTGLLDPLIAGFELLKPAVGIIDTIVHAFDDLPGPLKHSVALLLEAVVAMNALKAASAAGVASSGIGRLLGGGRQLAGTLLNPFSKHTVAIGARAAAADSAEAARAELAAVRLSGQVKVGEAAAANAAAGYTDASKKAVTDAEIAAENELRVATGALAAAEIKLTEATNAASAAKVKEAESDNADAASKVREAEATNAASAALARFILALREGGVAGLASKGGAALTAERRLIGTGENGLLTKVGQRLTAPVGVGGILTAGAADAYFGYSVYKNTRAQQAARGAVDDASLTLDAGFSSGHATSSSIRSGAESLNAAADKVDKSLGGFTGTISRFLGTNTVDKTTSAYARSTAAVEKSIADQQDQLGSTNRGAFDLSAPDGVAAGFKILAASGLTARQQINALIDALDHTAVSGKNAAGALDEYAASRLPGLVSGGSTSALASKLDLDISTAQGKGGGLSRYEKAFASDQTKKDNQAGVDAKAVEKELSAPGVQELIDKQNQQFIDDYNHKNGIKAGSKRTPEQLKQDAEAYAEFQETAYKKAGVTLYGNTGQEVYDSSYASYLAAQRQARDLTHQNIAKETPAQILAQAPALAAQANSDAATNVALGLNADGTKKGVAPKPPKPLDPLDAGNGQIGQSQNAAQARYEFQLNKYRHDQNRAAKIEHEGAAVTGDREQLDELNRLRAALVKNGASKQQLAEFDQQYAAVRLKLQQDLVTNLQSLEAFAVANLGEFDKSGVLKTQLDYLDQQIKITKDPQALRALRATRLQTLAQQADQKQTDQANALLAAVSPADTTGTAEAVAEGAVNKLTQILNDPHHDQGAVDAQRIIVNQTGLAAEQARQGDITTRANNQLGIGDTLGEQRNAYQALYRQADDNILDPTQLLKDRDRRAGAAGRADYRIASNQAYGALALSKIDPRDALANDRTQLGIDQRALQRVKPGDIAGKAAAQAALRDLNLKTIQDQLDYANSLRLASSDPQNHVQAAKNAMLDANARLAAANKNQADYGQLKQTALQKQQDFANSVVEQANSSALSKIDPRDTLGLDQQAITKTRGLLAAFKGSHNDQAYKDLLTQLHQEQVTFVDDQVSKTNAQIEANTDSRDVTGEAAAKVAEARNTLAADLPGTAKYLQDQKALADALLTQAQAQVAVANAAEEASIAPGDAIGEARAAIDAATRALANDIPGQAQYFDDQKKLREAEFALARAQEDYATTLEALSTDQTNPVVTAQNALDAARRKYSDDARLGADPATLAGDQLAVSNDQNAVQRALFTQQLQDAQTNFSLHRTSGAAYIRYLRSVQSNLKATGLGTRQLLDEYNEVSQQLLSANQQLSGQFNIGQIKLPTIYQERRQALQNGIDISSTTDNTGGNSFGSATDPLQLAAQQTISPLVAAVKQINTQAAVDQLGALQSMLNALGGGATPAGAATSPLTSAGGPSPGTVVNHTTINGADFSQVVNYLSSVLGTQAITTRTLTNRKVP